MAVDVLNACKRSGCRIKSGMAGRMLFAGFLVLGFQDHIAAQLIRLIRPIHPICLVPLE